MKKKMTTYQIAVTALLAAVTCILGPIAVPVGPVPISLTNLVIYFAIYLLGTRMGTVSYLVYLLIGAAGLPVFSGYSGGLMKLAGPTGGYLIGFIPMAILSGICLERSHGRKWFAALGMAFGTLVAYMLGTVWFVVLMKCGVWYALTVCVFPFVIGDAVKIVLALLIGSMLRASLQKAGLLKILPGERSEPAK